jgi:hypothetical protein
MSSTGVSKYDIAGWEIRIENGELKVERSTNDKLSSLSADGDGLIMI